MIGRLQLRATTLQGSLPEALRMNNILAGILRFGLPLTRPYGRSHGKYFSGASSAANGAAGAHGQTLAQVHLAGESIRSCRSLIWWSDGFSKGDF